MKCFTFVQHSQQTVDMYSNWGRLITLPQTPTQIYGVLRQSQGYPKPVLQQSHSTPAGFAQQYPAIPQQHYSNPRQHYSNLTADHTASPQQSHGRPTATPAIAQQCQGNTAAIAQKSQKAIPAQHQANATAIPQQSHRNPTAILQQSHSRAMAIDCTMAIP